MIRLNQIRRPNKKPLLIFAGLVVVVIALCMSGWWYNAYRATDDYHAQLSSYFESAKKELKTSGDQFKALTKEGDANKVANQLTQLGNTLANQEKSVPALPQLFGVTLTPHEDMQKRGEVIQRIKQLAGGVKMANELLTYQMAATLVLQEVTTKTGANAEQQKAMADAWSAMIAKLQAIRPPGNAQGTHQQILAALTAAQPHIAALPDLFSKKDVAGFTAKQREIEAHINGLRALANGIQLLNINQDKTIARDYQNLLDILK